MSGDVAAEVAAVLGDLIVTHPMWIGDDGEPLDYLPEREARLSDFVHEATDALGPLIAERVEAAEQRGREDNADHGQCYVHGSRALEARLADAWDEGYDDGYRTTSDGFGTPNPYRGDPR